MQFYCILFIQTSAGAKQSGRIAQHKLKLDQRYFWDVNNVNSLTVCCQGVEMNNFITDAIEKRIRAGCEIY